MTTSTNSEHLSGKRKCLLESVRVANKERNKLRERERRLLETEAEKEFRRKQNRERMRSYRHNLSMEEKEIMKELNRERQRMRRKKLRAEKDMQRNFAALH